MDEINEAWSESRLNKPKKYPMPLWLTDDEFDLMVMQVWKSRKTEPACDKLYQRLKAVQDCVASINNN